MRSSRRATRATVRIGAFTTADLPVRERRERQSIVDRLRALLDSGRTVMAVGEGEPARRRPADDDDAATDGRRSRACAGAAEEVER